MKIKKIGVVIIMFFTVSSFIYGQKLKQKIADSYYSSLSFVRAVELYEDLADSKKVNSHVLRRLASSYSKLNMFDKSVIWYEKLYNNGEANLDDKYEYMLMLRKVKDYEGSLEVLKDYYNSGGEDKFTKFVLDNPDFMDLYFKDSARYTINNETAVNSKENDFGVSYYGNGILFASPSREKKRLSHRDFKWDETHFLNLYYASKENDKLSSVKKIKIEKNEQYHDGPAVVDPTNPSVFYLTRSHFLDKKRRVVKSREGTVEVNLYIIRASDDNKFKWTSPSAFPGTSPEYSTGNATISADGNYIVVASDRPGTRGASDLWMVKREGNGWGPCINLGSEINSPRRENFPFLAKNGDLYFSSDDGQLGLGGYDVYRVINFLGGNRKVENIGYPINSHADDFGFIIDTDKSDGYFNSNREGGQGKDDIYSLKQNYALLKVCVIDKKTKKPIEGSNVFINTPLGDDLGKIVTKTEGCTDYKEMTALLSYVLSATKEGYDDSEEKKISLARGERKKITLELGKVPEKIKKPPCPKIILEDIYYDFDKYFIRNDASASLDELLEFLLEYKDVRIKLGSHTDCRGSRKYNDWLSQRRAEACVNYLINRGVEPSRLNAVGYGERQLVNHCSDGVPCSKREHQANRRTEIMLQTDDCLTIEKKPNRYLE